jgi:hypothetical protein
MPLRTISQINVPYTQPAECFRNLWQRSISISACRSVSLIVHTSVQDHIMSRERREEAADESAAGGSHENGPSSELSQNEKQKAATMIQRNYRGYRERRQMEGIGMSASARWSDAISELRYRERTRPMSREHALASGDAHTRAKRNWQRFSTIASRAAADDSDDDSDDYEDSLPIDHEERQRKKVQVRLERAKHAKQMDLQYWLEMVDQKHRYGSHLRTYHEVRRFLSYQTLLGSYHVL